MGERGGKFQNYLHVSDHTHTHTAAVVKATGDQQTVNRVGG